MPWTEFEFRAYNKVVHVGWELIGANSPNKNLEARFKISKFLVGHAERNLRPKIETYTKRFGTFPSEEVLQMLISELGRQYGFTVKDVEITEWDLG